MYVYMYVGLYVFFYIWFSASPNSRLILQVLQSYS